MEKRDEQELEKLEFLAAMLLTISPKEDSKVAPLKDLCFKFVLNMPTENLPADLKEKILKFKFDEQIRSDTHFTTKTQEELVSEGRAGVFILADKNEPGFYKLINIERSTTLRANFMAPAESTFKATTLTVFALNYEIGKGKNEEKGAIITNENFPFTSDKLVKHLDTKTAVGINKFLPNMCVIEPPTATPTGRKFY